MSLLSYWLPITVSAVAVFVVSAGVWMLFKWHNGDFRRSGEEEAVRAALKGSSPGYYLVPYCMDPAELQDPGMQQKYEDGPLAYVTVCPNGVPKMGGKLVGSLIFYLVVGVLCAYVLSLTAATGFLAVCRVTATVAWIAYGVAYVQDSVWFGRPWSITAKNLLDALIYGLVTGAVFGWLA